MGSTGRSTGRLGVSKARDFFSQGQKSFVHYCGRVRGTVSYLPCLNLNGKPLWGEGGHKRFIHETFSSYPVAKLQ